MAPPALRLSQEQVRTRTDTSFSVMSAIDYAHASCARSEFTKNYLYAEAWQDHCADGHCAEEEEETVCEDPNGGNFSVNSEPC